MIGARFSLGSGSVLCLPASFSNRLKRSIVGVQVLIAVDNPREVFVWVFGDVGRSCTEHHSTLQKQEGDTITIKITKLTTIREGVSCIEEARAYYETAYLGILSPGDYRISVNGMEKQRRID